MWWLWILLGVLALLMVTVCCVPVVIAFRFNKSPLGGEVWLQYGFAKKQLFPKPQKDKPKKNKKKPSSDQASAKNSKHPVRSLVQEQGPMDAVALMVGTASTLLDTVKTLVRGAKLRRFQGVFRIGGQDAADAATNYGQVCALLYPFLGLVSSLMTFVDPDLQVVCDYDGKESEIHARGEIHISPLRVPFAAVYALRYLIKQNLAKGGK